MRRRRYHIGDLVLFTERKYNQVDEVHISTTYITVIEQAYHTRSGYAPYRLTGFNHYVGRKQLNEPTAEHKLKYRLFNFHGAVPLEQL